SWPSARKSLPNISSVRTTPLICGAHASVTMRTLMRSSPDRIPMPAGIAPPGLTRRILRLYKRGLAAGGNQGCVSLRSSGCPAQNLQISAGIFDKGRTAFNPVSVVKVEDVADHAHLGLVDMAAHDAIDAARGGRSRDD